MAICRQCWEPLAEVEPGVLACAKGHGHLVDEAWLRAHLSTDSWVAWQRAIAAATPTTHACSACGADVVHAAFRSSWWPVSRLTGLPRFHPLVVGAPTPWAPWPYVEEVAAQRCVACARTWFDTLGLGLLRDRGPAFTPLPQHAPPTGVCPRCYQKLDADDRCERHGTLVRGSRLEPILEGRAEAVKTLLGRAPGGGPRCPACTTQMRRLTLDGCELDACAFCSSIWLEGKAIELGPRLPNLLLALDKR
ncbi:MAG: hypothetical protein QOE90_584 [Thermoplasmata archaeon]|jgi:hypothetical protein|nr:hypothetical protein [Thermoplasmata archaeon]